MVGRCWMAMPGQPVISSQVEGPLVSVVIPMFQSAEWIGPTLATVEAQTYPLIETIVVDDGSTDHGSEVVAEFASSCERPVRLIRTTNRGVAAARNTGITESDGEFVALLDADDLWGPRKLELQVARLGASGAPMCTCGYEFFDGERNFGYGGYRYDGRWIPIVKNMSREYLLNETLCVKDATSRTISKARSARATHRTKISQRRTC